MRPMSRTGSVGRNRKPREEVNLHELEANCQASPTPRRASSSVSQMGVSADDRKRLCEQSKLNSESSGMGHAAYGSLTYQLEHATMEPVQSVSIRLQSFVHLLSDHILFNNFGIISYAFIFDAHYGYELQERLPKRTKDSLLSHHRRTDRVN
ncbi:hypothetical protein WDU94_009018 [Cyamophila willieti]